MEAAYVPYGVDFCLGRRTCAMECEYDCLERQICAMKANLFAMNGEYVQSKAIWCHGGGYVPWKPICC